MKYVLLPLTLILFSLTAHSIEPGFTLKHIVTNENRDLDREPDRILLTRMVNMPSYDRVAYASGIVGKEELSILKTKSCELSLKPTYSPIRYGYLKPREYVIDTKSSNSAIDQVSFSRSKFNEELDIQLNYTYSLACRSGTKLGRIEMEFGGLIQFLGPGEETPSQRQAREDSELLEDTFKSISFERTIQYWYDKLK